MALAAVGYLEGITSMTMECRGWVAVMPEQSAAALERGCVQPVVEARVKGNFCASKSEAMQSTHQRPRMGRKPRRQVLGPVSINSRINKGRLLEGGGRHQASVAMHPLGALQGGYTRRG